MRWALFERASIVQLLKNFPAFYGAWRIVVSLTHQPHFTPQEDSWYAILFEAVNPRAIVLLEGLGKLKESSDPIGIRTCDLPYTIAPQPTMLPYAPV
jgi:hypothetical protein